MNKAYICSVASDAQENYQIGLIAGRWGVAEQYRNRIAPVRPGDRIVFVVGGEFRSIHQVLSDPYDDRTQPGLWPERDGDIYPYRVEIGPAEVSGGVRVADLAPQISFMQPFPTTWGGTLRGRNGVFNDRLTDLDLMLIQESLAQSAGQSAEIPDSAAGRRLIDLPPIQWLPDLLDQLTRLSNLERARALPDPFQGADEFRDGLFAGVYVDRLRVPTLAVLPVERGPKDTVLSTLYGLSALKLTATSKPKEVRGLIYTREHEPAYESWLHGLPNVRAVGFDVQVQLRS